MGAASQYARAHVSLAGTCHTEMTVSGASQVAARSAANVTADAAASEPSTPTTTGRPGPGGRAGPVGTSTTGQQAWAMTVSDLAPSRAEVKAPCSARPSTSRLACRDASTRAPAAPPVAGKLLACTPGPHRQCA